jgi:hypothetical protein
MIASIRTFTVLSGLFLFLIVALPDSSTAQKNQAFITAQDIDADIVQRVTPDQAEEAIRTRGGSVDLMLTDSRLIIQFSDHFLENIQQEINKERTGDSGFVDAILSAVSGGVQTLLDRAMAIPLHELREIRYDDGRLIIIHQNGKEIFNDLEVDGIDVMEDFTPDDGHRFAAAAERLMI